MGGLVVGSDTPPETIGEGSAHLVEGCAPSLGSARATQAETQPEASQAEQEGKMEPQKREGDEGRQEESEK